ncbi:MAG: hypothetical protein IJC04_04735 [Oscillospiraceae bacterium]|nr:hypothetical protein [Oscillospiraceae bacterium]
MTEQNSTFDRQITVKFNRHLEIGEHIVWCGKGVAVAGVKANLAAKLYMIFFATLWTAFALFWTVGMFRAGGGMMSYFGVLFIVVGIVIYVKAFSAGRTKAFFAVTNMRILTDAGRGFEMEYLTNITSVQVKEKGSKADVVYSIEYQGENNVISGNGTIGGLTPEEAENVRYIIESESSKVHMYL